MNALRTVAFAYAAMALSTGCTTPATEVLVVMNSDAPADRTLTVRATVYSGSVQTGDASMVLWSRGDDAGAPLTLPASFAVTPGTTPTDGTVTLVLDVTLGASTVGQPASSFRRTTRFAFARGETTEVPIFLATSCADATVGCRNVARDRCTVSEYCEEHDETCGDFGVCVAPEVVPVLLDGGAFADVTTEHTTDVAADVPLDEASSFDATDASDAVDAVAEDTASDATMPPIAAPRPIAPMSTSFVSTHRPMLEWQLAGATDGAQVEISHDRAFGSSTTVLMASGTSVAPPSALAPGVWYWRLRGMRGSVVGTDTSAGWEFTVKSLDAPTQQAWGSVLDVNGDGLRDVAVGGFAANQSTGEVAVFFGAPGGLASTPGVVLDGIFGTQGDFGLAVSSAGDVNGDGFGDLIVGEPAPNATSSPGRAYVYLGGASGLASTPASTLVGTDGDGSRFGTSVSYAGDLDEDGYGDVIVGAPRASPNGSTSAGRAYVFFGSASGIATRPPFVIDGVDANGHMGLAVGSAGDLNGDHHVDLVAAAADVNQLFVIYGDGTATPTNSVVFEPSPYSEFGDALGGPGDINGDGLPDLLVGGPDLDPTNHTGAAFIFLGADGGISMNPTSMLSAPGGAGSYFGWSVAIVSDADGDGYDDVAIGAPGESGMGVVRVYSGGAGGVATTASVSIPTTQSAADLGEAIDGVGDVNGDGFADLAIGADGYDGYDGALFVHLGGASGVDAMPALTYAPSGGAQIGMAVASRRRAALPEVTRADRASNRFELLRTCASTARSSCDAATIRPFAR